MRADMPWRFKSTARTLKKYISTSSEAYKHANTIHKMEKRTAGRVHGSSAGRIASLANQPEYLHLGLPAEHFLLAILRAGRVYGRDGSANSPQQHFADRLVEHSLVHCPVD